MKSFVESGIAALSEGSKAILGLLPFMTLCIIRCWLLLYSRGSHRWYINSKYQFSGLQRSNLDTTKIMLFLPLPPRTKMCKMSLIGRLASMLMVTNPFHKTCHKTVRISHVNYMYTLSTETLLDTIIPIINAMSRSTSQMEAQLERTMLYLCFYYLWLV